MAKDNNESDKALSESLSQDGLDDSELDSALLRGAEEVFESALRDAFKHKRDFFIQQLYSRLRSSGAVGAQDAQVADEEEWIEIESLSRLRSVVGGRFQNIKKKWIGAGLPLREHRGDKSQDFEINQDGWIELTSWVMKQGFEARLTPQKETALFELKPNSSK